MTTFGVEFLSEPPAPSYGAAKGSEGSAIWYEGRWYLYLEGEYVIF